MIQMQDINEALVLLSSGRTQACHTHLESMLRVERILERGAQSYYEALRKEIDGGSETMTHSDAIDWIRRMQAFDNEMFMNTLVTLLVFARDVVPLDANEYAEMSERSKTVNTVLTVLCGKPGEEVEP